MTRGNETPRHLNGKQMLTALFTRRAYRALYEHHLSDVVAFRIDLLPALSCDFSVAGIEVEAAEVEQDVDLEALSVPVAEGLLHQASDPIVEAF